MSDHYMKFKIIETFRLLKPTCLNIWNPKWFFFFSFWMQTMQNTTHIFGGVNSIESDLITIKACVICVKSFIQTNKPLYIQTCVIGGWIKQSVVQKQFIVKMIWYKLQYFTMVNKNNNFIENFIWLSSAAYRLYSAVKYYHKTILNCPKILMYILTEVHMITWYRIV